MVVLDGERVVFDIRVIASAPPGIDDDLHEQAGDPRERCAHVGEPRDGPCAPPPHELDAGLERHDHAGEAGVELRRRQSPAPDRRVDDLDDVGRPALNDHEVVEVPVCDGGEGVATRELLSHVTVSPRARFVMVHCEYGFTTNLSAEDFFGHDCLFAMRHNGEDLAPDHGQHVRDASWTFGVDRRFHLHCFDREQFLALSTSSNDGLFISKPETGKRTSLT